MEPSYVSVPTNDQQYHPQTHYDGIPTPTKKIDVAAGLYPYCIVWSPLPMITWLCPIIGHMGICDSQGIIWDFAGPYSINRNDMAFGRPTRYLQLDPSLIKAALEGGAKESGETIKIWDDCVHHSNCHYSKRMHNICCQNCHHHTARALGQMKYRGTSHWSQITLAFWIFFCAPFTNVWGFISTFAPFLFILSIILYTQLVA
jgi:transmembrane protein 222|tara:strand:+ start:55 stop:660 length:606 start_codon:yes stop_codon:yes gene_type:complete